MLKKHLKTGLKPAVVEKRSFTVFIVTCALGLAVGMDLFQLHVHRVCLCSLPTEPAGLQLKNFTFVQGGIDILKFDKNRFVVFHI